ncbi:ABC transporter ATP-binding protein [Paenibacillus sacheonensis]|uniref:ATP-binding cassette domain-containing protein n=1 Tax=Paenibacillus sacheonensis TaxID=742054 RepID=A0A7X4YMP7_9BACL|nr:ABC transporter ATP-binding protein [Paenibacillus sacheonensis]MBM7563178.1 ABC-2 type transport system ATP-binding protein [Paenibacillus sacheonensis]NBC68259.1 ATP-binding cassette domain-containing protein [Paenibacillus sacheonensis]
MSAIVEAKRLTKTYGSFTAVNNVSFTIEPDKIYGLLGRNGAGKTTIMHLITAQLFASSGELLVFGQEPYENERVLRQTCFIKESQKYPDTFRVTDVLGTAAMMFPNWDEGFAKRLLTDFNLPLKRRMKKLSRGMLSSVGIIIGLASRAPLTIFDEPYLGLDAVARNIFYERLMEDYAEFPRTVILSTHLIDEVSKLLEHVIVIDGGQILLDEEADSLRGRAYTVTGPSAKIDAYAAGKPVIHQEALGGSRAVTVFERLGATDQKQAEALGLQFSPVTIQQLIVCLTTRSSEQKGAYL